MYYYILFYLFIHIMYTYRYIYNIVNRIHTYSTVLRILSYLHTRKFKENMLHHVASCRIAAVGGQKAYHIH